MASLSAVRSRRRNAGQLHALASLEREIRATDPNGRRKYLRDFSEAYHQYQCVLSRQKLSEALAEADIVLVGDYHALALSQRFAAEILESLARSGRKVVLGLETIFARDQHIVEEWMRGEIDSEELRERIRFDRDWGYQWPPFLELLESARRHAVAAYGLDCMPRDDLRKIAARDRHAADKTLDIRARHPGAVVVVVFGESHLAPNHIPALLKAQAPDARIVTLLQNVDPLYWRAAGERRETVEAVRVAHDVYCVFNATPLEKYESYRLCIERWKQERASALDLAPTFYNLVGALARFLNIATNAPHNGTQPKFLVDMLPEVCYRPSEDGVRKLLARKQAGPAELQDALARWQEHGACYVPRLNTLLVREFEVAGGAEETARFLHHACRGMPAQSPADGKAPEAEDRFYSAVLEQTLAHFGSRALCPSRPAVRESELYGLYTQTRETIEDNTSFGYREYMQMIDFLILHRDYELNLRRYSAAPDLVRQGVRAEGEKLEFIGARLGAMLGSDLYDAYLAGRVTRRYIRDLFFRKLDPAAVARETYFDLARRVRLPGQRRMA